MAIDLSASCQKVRLAIVDDETLVCEALRSVFEKCPELEVIAAGPTWNSVSAQVQAGACVVLFDVGSLTPAAWEELRVFMKTVPTAHFVLLDEMLRDWSIRMVLRRGIHGYATKADTLDEIRKIVLAAARGEQVFSGTAHRRVEVTSYGWKLREGEAVPGLHMLTTRETEILTYLAEGHTSVICAKILGISANTIDNHKAKIMKKLKIHKLTDLVRFAIQEGLIPAVDFPRCSKLG